MCLLNILYFMNWKIKFLSDFFWICFILHTFTSGIHLLTEVGFFYSISFRIFTLNVFYNSLRIILLALSITELSKDAR